MKTEWIFQTEEEMGELIDIIVSQYETGSTLVLALSGDLGAGKTTFTQLLGKRLGVQELITSPTFTIMSSYELATGPFTRLIHIDAYRIEDESEIGPLRLEEAVHEVGSLVCIEWPENVPSLIPEDAIRLRFEILPDESRKVTIV